MTDILSLLPSNFYTDLESKKWTERRDILQTFLDLLDKIAELDPGSSYGDIVSKLKNILERDANINVCALAAKCIRGIARGLGPKFGSYVGVVLPVIFEKLKEKKQVLRDPLIESIDTIFLATNLENLSKYVCAAMEKPNPNIKKETDLFLSRCFKYFNAGNVSKKFIKEVLPSLLKHASDPDPEVREASYSALGSMMRATGEASLTPLLSNLTEDKAKMEKIKDYCQQILAEVGPNGISQSAEDTETTSDEIVTSENTEESEVAATNGIDPFELLDPVDVLAKLPKEFYTNLQSTKWTERKDTLQDLLDLLDKNPKLEPNAHYGEVVDNLKKILLKDSNINVCAVAVKVIRGLALGLRTKFAPYTMALIALILDKFKEKKPVLKEPLVACIDALFPTIKLEQIEEDIIAAMNKQNPNIKMQTDLFLCRSFQKFNLETMPKKFLKSISTILVKHTGDSDPEVREAAYAAFGSAMRTIGEPTLLPLLTGVSDDKMKMAKIKEHCDKIIVEIGPCKSVPKSTSASQPAIKTASKAGPPVVQKRPVTNPSTSRNVVRPVVSATKPQPIPASKTNVVRVPAPVAPRKPVTINRPPPKPLAPVSQVSNRPTSAISKTPSYGTTRPSTATVPNKIVLMNPPPLRPVTARDPNSRIPRPGSISARENSKIPRPTTSK